MFSAANYAFLPVGWNFTEHSFGQPQGVSSSAFIGDIDNMNNPPMLWVTDLKVIRLGHSILLNKTSVL